MSEPSDYQREHNEVAEKVRDAVAGAVAGTSWAPPEGGLIVDCVVFLGFYNANGTYGASHLRCGSPWATHGLVEDQLERMDLLRQNENTPCTGEDD